jgi:hypothetical protein
MSNTFTDLLAHGEQLDRIVLRYHLPYMLTVLTCTPYGKTHLQLFKGVSQ